MKYYKPTDLEKGMIIAYWKDAHSESQICKKLKSHSNKCKISKSNIHKIIIRLN